MAKVKVARLHSAQCVAVEGSINSELVQEASARTRAVEDEARKVLGNTPNPKAYLVGEAFSAGSHALKEIPNFLGAIRRAEKYPDQLYMTFNNQPGVDNRFWPRPQKYHEIYAGQIIRFDELRYPLTESLNISLWEYDYGPGDDLLGNFVIEKETKPGTYVKLVTSASASDSEPSIYLVAYTVAEEEP